MLWGFGRSPLWWGSCVKTLESLRHFQDFSQSISTCDRLGPWYKTATVFTTSPADAKKEQWEGVEQTDGYSCGGVSIYVWRDTAEAISNCADAPASSSLWWIEGEDKVKLSLAIALRSDKVLSAKSGEKLFRTTLEDWKLWSDQLITGRDCKVSRQDGCPGGWCSSNIYHLSTTSWKKLFDPKSLWAQRN